MVKRIKLKKLKFFIVALAMFSVMSVNNFSAAKKSSQKTRAEWKKITLEPDLNGDGIKDKIDVEYAEVENNVNLKIIPYVFSDKAKFQKGKQMEKIIDKSDFEEKFDSFIKEFIAEYPKKNGVQQPSKNQKENTKIAPTKETKPEKASATTTNNEIDETNKKSASKKKIRSTLKKIRKTAKP